MALTIRPTEKDDSKIKEAMYLLNENTASKCLIRATYVVIEQSEKIEKLEDDLEEKTREIEKLRKAVQAKLNADYELMRLFNDSKNA